MKNFFSFFFALILLTTTTLVNAQVPTSQTFTTSGTYTVNPPFAAIVLIEAWGAGGGGGSNTSGAKGGGGGGAYASLTTTLYGGSYTVTVAGVAAAGSAGVSSSFTTIVIAAGGSSTTDGTGGAGGTIAASTGSTRIAGTVGANAVGNAGGAGGAGANGGGTGGAGGPAGNNNGTDGNPPGGGGGGKAGPGASATSGLGARGEVRVTVLSVLPVKLSSIKAYEKQNGIQIDWTALTETNLSIYQVERSADGLIFTAIGDVIALNSLSASNYSFFDANPMPGVSFYRLKSIDIDGKFSYSSIMRVNLDKNVTGISVYPNPVTGGYVSFQSSNLVRGSYSVKLFAASGQQVYSQRFTHSGGAINQTIQLPAGIKSGMYSMQLDNDGVKVMTKTFMVQ